MLLEDPYRLHQTHKMNQVGTIWHRDLWYIMHVIQHAILYDHCSEYGILHNYLLIEFYTDIYLL